MKMPSVMGSRFSQVPSADISRSQFDRSSGYKTTFDAGLLIPFFVDDVLPGDTFNVQMSAFARLATPLRPIMDNMYLDTFWFFVPNRLVWENWERFNGQQDDPDDSTDFVIPQATSSGSSVGTIADYMGLPTGVAFSVSALPFRAYALIWNEWFRDQNLQDSLVIPKGDASASVNSYGGLKRRGKRHDYFTSALPWPQKGEAVQIPLGERAEVHAGSTVTLYPSVYFDHGGIDDYRQLQDDNAGGGANRIAAASSGGTEEAVLYADLSTATGASINALRQAFQVQKLLERDARGGTRYTEIIRSHFRVVSPDARLQRPEYLGGGSTPVNISPVANTSGTATENQGDLAGIGTVSFSRNGFVKSFTEHGYIIGLMSVRADLTYQQGIERHWSRETRYDFFWPALQHIGEQAVLNKEIFAQGTTADDDVFGYQERYAEYRYKPSQITGLFRSQAAESLDMWHLSQEFSALPELNSAFIQEDPPIDRIIAVPSEPHFLFDSYIRAKCARPMPVYGVPGFLDHF